MRGAQHGATAKAATQQCTDAALTAEDVAHYRRDGFVVRRGLLSAEEVALVRAAIEADDSLSSDETTILFIPEGAPLPKSDYENLAGGPFLRVVALGARSGSGVQFRYSTNTRPRLRFAAVARSSRASPSRISGHHAAAAS